MANEFKVKKGLIVDGSNTVLDIQGTQGQLFSVTDSLTGDLFSVSDVSGMPILNVNSSGIIDVDAYMNIDGYINLSGTTTDYYIGGSGGGEATNELRIGSRTTSNTVALELFHVSNPVSLGITYSGGAGLAFIESAHGSYDVNTHLLFKPGGTETWRIGSHGTASSNVFLIKPASNANDFIVADAGGTAIVTVDSGTRAVTFVGNTNINGGQILTPGGVDLSLNPNTGLVNIGGVIRATGTGANKFTGGLVLGTPSNGNLVNKLTIASGTNGDGIFLTGLGTAAGMGTGHYKAIDYQYSNTDSSFGSAIRFVTVDSTLHGGQIQLWTDDSSGNIQKALTLDKSQNASFTGSVTTETGGSVFGGSGGIPIYARSTGTVSYMQFQTSSTGSNGSNDGLTVGVNGSTAYVWNRENTTLHLGTNDTSALALDNSQNATFASDVTAQGFHIDAAALQSFQDFQSKPIDTDSGLFTVGGHGMSVGYSRAISLWSTTAGVYRSWVGTNLRWDGTNYRRATNAQNNNWGNIAGIQFWGNNAATGKAIEFIIDPPENSSGGSQDATIGTSLPAGYTALTINNDLSANFAGNVAVNNLALPDGHDIGWDGGFSSSKPTLAANGTTMKMYPSGNAASAQFTLSPTVATFGASLSALTVTARDNMFVDAGQLYIGADDSTTDNTYRQLVSTSAGSFTLQKRISGTFTDILSFNNSNNATFAGTIALGGATSSAAITLADHTTAAGGIKFRTAASTVSLFSNGSGNLTCAADFNSAGRIRLPGGHAVADPDIGFTGATAGTGFSRAGQDITFIAGGAEKMRLNSTGNFGVGDALPSSISANTSSLSVNSSRNDLSGALINKANGTIKHQQYWDSSGYGFNLSANSGDFKWKVNNNDRMVVDKDGGLDIQGTAGQLFSVTNSLTGDIFSVADISGIPILNVNSSGLSTFDGDVKIDGSVENNGITTYNTPAGGVAFNLDAAADNYGTFRLRTNGNANKWDVGMKNDNDFYIYNQATGAQALEIDTANNIATFAATTKSTRFTSTSTSGLHFMHYTGSQGWQIGSDSTAAGMYIYHENATYAMKLTSSGSATFAGNMTCGVINAGDITGAELESKHAAAPVLKLRREDSSIVDGNSIGQILFQGDDPSATNTGAAIKGIAAGTWNMGSPNVYPSELVFQTAKQATLLTALTLNEDQKATFNSNVDIGVGTANVLQKIHGSGTAGVQVFTPGRGYRMAT
jgi:hypothetical protein